MPQVLQSNDLGAIGLSPLDLEQRTIIAVGWAKGEILSPYSSEKEKKDSELILAYLSGKQFFKSQTGLYPERVKENFTEIPKVVEVVGGLIEWCVFNTAESFLESGSYVVLNPKLTFCQNPKVPPSFRSKLMKHYLLPDNPERRCLIYGGNLIFYELDCINNLKK